MGDKDLEFSIVSGSDEEMLFGCLESLAKTLKGSRYSWSVAVTCAMMGSGLSHRIRTRYPGVTVFENDIPKSSAASHNRVLRISRARYVWLLDSDTLVLPDAVRLVIEFLDRAENARVGVTSPQLLNPDGTRRFSSYAFPSLRRLFLTELGLSSKYPKQIPGSNYGRAGSGSAGLGHVSHVIDVDTLASGCVAIRMNAFRQVGPMVETALPGSELPEWHRRFHEQGWRVTEHAEASIIHYGGQAGQNASGTSNPDRLKRDLFFFKSSRPPAVYTILCAGLAVTFAARTAIAQLRRDRDLTNAARRCKAIALEGLVRA